MKTTYLQPSVKMIDIVVEHVICASGGFTPDTSGGLPGMPPGGGSAMPAPGRSLLIKSK